jgi:hypothetical protein
MLGNKVWEGLGQVIGMRVLENGKLEISGAIMGTMFDGDDFSSTFTYEMEIKPDGTSYGEIRGFYSTKVGVMGRFKGNGNAILGPGGSGKHRGALCYFNPPGKYAYMNGIACVYEYDVDEDQKIHAIGWEWK